MTNKLIQLMILLLLLCGIVNAQDTEKKKAKNQKSRYTLALMPATTFPEEGFDGYSVGYGFNMNASYKLTEDISLSGNIEIIFSDFNYSDMYNMYKYNATSHWYSFDIGPKFFLNRGTTRIYINSNFKYTLIYHSEGDKRTGELLNPEQAIGFSFGFGFEIPVNDNFKIEVSPVCNILYPINNKEYIHTLDSYSSNVYYKISLGLNYNL
jgi:hypothetical protein